MLRARSTNRFNSKPFIGSGSYVNETVEEDHLLERQFENIIAAIQNLKQKDYEEKVTLSELEENISDLDKKIELLEKILASNFTEAEVILFIILDPEEILFCSKITKVSPSQQKGKDHS